MRISLLVLWAIIGMDCGTPWPGWWRWRLPPPPPPEPDPYPRPNWLLTTILGIVGGLAGGWAFTETFGTQTEAWSTLASAAATGVGAFAGGRLFVGLYELATAGGKAMRA
jgi:hypothetical protein